MVRSQYHFWGVILCLAVLAGCTDLKRGLGFEKNVPDEFRVVTRPPLTLPPDYNLRPPGESVSRTPTAQSRASSLLKGGESVESPAVQSGTPRALSETVLLRKAGAAEADPAIRDQLRDDADADDSDGFWARVKAGALLVDVAPEEEGEVLNPVEELERLTQGSVPDSAVTVEDAGMSDASVDANDSAGEADGE